MTKTTTKTKIRAKYEAFFGGRLIKPGYETEIDGCEIPIWAEVIGEVKGNKQESNKPEGNKTEENKTEENKTEENKPEGNAESEKLRDEFEDLLTEALDYEIYYVADENKTLTEQITELKALIEKGKETKNV